MENLKKQIQHAVDAFKSGRILEAEDLTSKLIESNPKVVFLYNLMGLILSAQKEIDKALDECQRLWPEKDIQIGAQVYLEKVYQQFGFARNSENYLEDGILHVDMMLSKVC